MIILKNQLDHQLNIMIPKQNSILRDVFWNVFVFYTTLSQSKFLYCSRCLHLFFSSQDFRSFCQLSKYHSRRLHSFSQLGKISFFHDESKWVEKTTVVLLSRMIINKFFRMTANIQLCIFTFKEGVKLV